MDTKTQPADDQVPPAVDKTEVLSHDILLSDQHPQNAEDDHLDSDETGLSKAPLLCLGAARTGTASLCEALRILGYSSVHHGTKSSGPSYNDEWQILNRAADATFPNLPTYTGKPFSRSEWDELLYRYDAITDVGSFYATSLIDAYPDAQVILVERDVEAWLKSVSILFKSWEDPAYEQRILKYGPYTGSAAGLASLKFLKGWTQSDNATDIFKNARSAYERHNRTVREKTADEKLLVLNLAEGWEPLCEFLGKPVPDVPFPRVNDSQQYSEWARKTTKQIRMQTLKNLILRRRIYHQ